MPGTLNSPQVQDANHDRAANKVPRSSILVKEVIDSDFGTPIGQQRIQRVLCGLYMEKWVVGWGALRALPSDDRDHLDRTKPHNEE